MLASKYKFYRRFKKRAIKRCGGCAQDGRALRIKAAPTV